MNHLRNQITLRHVPSISHHFPKHVPIIFPSFPIEITSDNAMAMATVAVTWITKAGCETRRCRKAKSLRDPIESWALQRRDTESVMQRCFFHGETHGKIMEIIRKHRKITEFTGIH